MAGTAWAGSIPRHPVVERAERQGPPEGGGGREQLPVKEWVWLSTHAQKVGVGDQFAFSRSQRLAL